MLTYAAWLATGSRLAVNVAGRRVEVFVRTAGPANARHVTLLHGFPTSSWDYHAVAPTLEERFQTLSFDFIGFGDSDKPRDFPYSIHAQADLVEVLWKHDYGVSVAQELLARTLDVKLHGVTFLNGGLYPDLHRALPIQKLLRHPLLGPVVSRLVNRRAFNKSLRAVFAIPPSATDLDAHWDAVTRRRGHRLYHRLIHYMGDRQRHAVRWSRALEQSTIPVSFIWGMLDPVSGAHVAARLAERLPNAPRIQLGDVGHYPQLEAPDRVLAALFPLLA